MVAARLGQLQQLANPGQLLCLGLTLLLRPGDLGVPLLRLLLIVQLLQSGTLLLPVVALLLPLLQPAGEIPQGMALVLAALQHPLQQLPVRRPVLDGRQQRLPLARQRGQGLALL
ncbi:hypothetical protein D3C73_1418280 [compost metagenome]